MLLLGVKLGEVLSALLLHLDLLEVSLPVEVVEHPQEQDGVEDDDVGEHGLEAAVVEDGDGRVHGRDDELDLDKKK